MTSSSATRSAVPVPDHRLLLVPQHSSHRSGHPAEPTTAVAGPAPLRRCLVARSARARALVLPAATTGCRSATSDGGCVEAQSAARRPAVPNQPSRMITASSPSARSVLTAPVAWTSRDRGGSAIRSMRVRASMALPSSAEPGPPIAVTPDGRLLATNDVVGLSILDATTHAVVRGSTRHRMARTARPRFGWRDWRSPVPAAVRLFDTETWRLVTGGPLRGPSADRLAYSDEIDVNHPADINRLNIERAIAFSPDAGGVVAAGSTAPWTWDARTGAPRPPLRHGPVFDVAFNPVTGAPSRSATWTMGRHMSAL